MPVKMFLAIKAVIVRNQKLLLFRKDLTADGFWDLPGGRIDAGENIPQALAREISEELPGVRTYQVGELLHAEKKVGYTPTGVEIAMLYYHVQTNDDVEQLSEEHSAFKWCSSEELSQLTQPVDAIPMSSYQLLLQKVLASSPTAATATAAAST